MFQLHGKVALVTGGSRGIGRAVSLALANAGAHVVVNYHTRAGAAEQVVKEIHAGGGHADAMGFDVADHEQVTTAVQALVKKHTRLDILVNNAGIAIDQLLLRLTPDALTQTLATNVHGAIYCAKAVIRPMMKTRSGRIVHITSVVGESGNPGQAAYSASKSALLGLTKTLAREYASRGITVNAVSPGYIHTDMTQALPEKARQTIVEQVPLGRMGDPEDVAAAVLYLASEAASYVTGHVLRVNGGMYM